MARNDKVKLADALASATPEQRRVFVDLMKKKERFYGILTLIPVVNWIFGGLYIFTRNTRRYIQSNKQPGGLAMTIVALWCLLIPPMIVTKIAGMTEGIQNKVLGVAAELKTWHYE